MDFNYATLLRLAITCYVCFTVTITDCIGWMPPMIMLRKTQLLVSVQSKKCLFLLTIFSATCSVPCY